MNAAAEAKAQSSEDLRPQAETSARPRRPAIPYPALAAAAVAVTVSSFVSFSGKPEAVPAPAAEPGTTAVASRETAAPALEVLVPAQFGAPQYEDGLVSLSLAAPVAALVASAEVSSTSAPAPAWPAASRLPAYRGPSLFATRPVRRLAAFAGLKLWGITSFREAAAQHAAEAAPVARGAADGVKILAGQLLQGARADIDRGMAEQWRKMTKEQQAAWAQEWERGATEQAKLQAAAKGKAVAKTETVCVGHTDKCTFGEMKVTYSDGSSEVVKYDPLVFDLGGNGFRASGKSVEYDLDGDGRTETLAELPAGSALLVLDSDKDGSAGAAAAELFSGYTDLEGDGKPDGFEDGFEAFNGLIRKAVREGNLPLSVLGSMRLGPDELAALGKEYGLKLRVGGFRGKDLSFVEAGVAEVGLSANRSVRRNSFDGQGTDIVRRSGAVFARADGTIGDYADLWLSPRKLRQLAFNR